MMLHSSVGPWAKLSTKLLPLQICGMTIT
ncbi:hypothetical protein P5673_032192 [Acropora cervicornis]|uniref:Uncharacterized protein n=1 Tax=Acropora cervicornis TaxID=6130 RepID=A0AAD9PRY0_ACRCE|nr:hypothetical protein P5673_032192 [Acropora cervicornis]